VLADGGEPRRINVIPVSASITEVLGVQPQLGRMFTDTEDRPPVAERRLLISDALWRSHFSAAPDVVGRIIRIGETPFTVTGVMPPGFDFPGSADAWTQLAASEAADRSDKALSVIGRLAPGATPAQARGELREAVQRWSRTYPESYSGWSAEIVPFSEWMVTPRMRDAVWVLMGAVTLLLLLACVNVANLLLAQSLSRHGEMRVRTALGAGRGRLIRQLLTESAVLALLGTTAGVLIAVWAVDLVRAIGGSSLTRLALLRVDGSVLTFACAAGVISCLTFGVAPAVYTTRLDLRSALDEGLRYTVRRSGLRRALVVIEVAMAMLLVVGAGLLANSFVRLVNVDPGFDLATIAMPIEHSSSRYGDERIDDFYRDALDRVRALPGVAAAGATTTNPLRQFGFSNSVTPTERAADAPPSGLVQAGWRSVTPGFFDAMGIPMHAGRAFSELDRDGAERVVIVTAGLAQRLWPGESAVGRQIYWGGTSGRPRTVIGVSGDIRDVQLDADPGPIVFVPHAQVPMPQLTIVLRTSTAVEQIAPALRQVIRDLDASLPAPDIYPLSASRANVTTASRFNLLLLASFAAIALVLAVTGVYALLSFMVSDRRREMAVRLALGASGAQLARMVLSSGLTLSLAGVIAGTGVAIAATHLLSRLLYEVTPTDPLTFVAAAAALLCSAAVASYVPALRAARLDAAAALNRTP
jgi:predicted permease